jgi:hypothetical protein
MKTNNNDDMFTLEEMKATFKKAGKENAQRALNGILEAVAETCPEKKDPLKDGQLLLALIIQEVLARTAKHLEAASKKDSIIDLGAATELCYIFEFVFEMLITVYPDSEQMIAPEQ